MISKAAQKKICQRSRQPTKYPPSPTADGYTSIPDRFKKTLDGGDFLLATVAVHGGNVLIFSTHENLRRLSTAKIWMLDGTFGTAPDGFKQIYSILGSVGTGDATRYLPLVYMFLPNKSEDTYTRALEEVSNLAETLDLELDPEVAVTDFERAAINAIGTVFPDCRRQGCFFHLTQNFYKRIQSSGASGVYANDNKIFMTFKRIEALAFVPLEFVEKAFQLVTENAPPAMEEFIRYVEENYVLGKIRKRKSDGTVLRSSPTFHPELWNVNICVLNHQPRTTNRLEGWHNRWKTVSQEAGFYQIIESLQKEQKVTEGEIMNVLQGIPVPKRNPREIEKDNRLYTLVSNFSAHNISDYVLGIALALKNY